MTKKLRSKKSKDKVKSKAKRYIKKREKQREQEIAKHQEAYIAGRALGRGL